MVALFLTPLATMVPAQAATPALVTVGFLILANSIKEIDWADYTIAIPAFLTIVMMPFTYSITNGIGFGFIAYVIVAAVTGQLKKVKPLMWIAALAFVIYFLAA